MPTMEIDFEVYCQKCGEGMCYNTTIERGNDLNNFAKRFTG